MKQTSGNLCEEYIHDAERDSSYYEIFFQMCRKYHVNWGESSEKEKKFISEVTRVTYERKKAMQTGLPCNSVRPAFSA